MTTVEYNLDEQASVNWIPLPAKLEDNTFYRGGQSRIFDSVRNAVRFVMEDLPSHQRHGATIFADSDRAYGIYDIERMYREKIMSKSQ